MFKKYKMRPWQNRAVEATQRILCDENKTHIYIQAPTGSGKSRAMLEIMERVPIAGKHYIVVGRDNIVRQHIESIFAEINEREITPNDVIQDELVLKNRQIVQITTWQALAAKAKNQIPLTEETGYIFFDECHLGGSGHEDEVKSIPTIFEHYKPAKKVYISATTLTANPKILGQKKDHFFVYTMQEAMSNGILHPVTLVEIHAGLNAKIAKLNNSVNLQVLDELYEDNHDSLLKKFKERKIEIDEKMVHQYCDLSAIKFKSAAQLYLKKHYGQQAIFFIPNIANATKFSKQFKLMCDRYKSKNSLQTLVQSRSLHSKIVGEQSEIISAFRQNKIQVLFVVGMLQEGFSHDTLNLAFDCNFNTQWNDSSTSRLIQKVGRLMRIDSSKTNPALYYFFRDITDYYHRKDDGSFNFKQDELNIPEIQDGDIGEDETVSSDTMLAESMGEFVATVIGINESQCDDVDADIEDGIREGRMISVGDTTVKEEDFEDFEDFGDTLDPTEITVTKATTVSTPLWCLHNVRDTQEGGKVIRSFSFATLFGNSADKNKEQLLEMAKNGDARPSSSKTSLGSALVSYTNESSGIFDAKFNEQIRLLRPDWFEKSADTKKQELLEMAKKGEPRPSSRTPLGSALSRYTNESNSFDAEFNKQIREANSDWFENSADKNKEILLEMAINGDPRPSKKRNPLGSALVSYTNESSGIFDAKFNEQIREANSDWFEKSADKNKEILLEMATRKDKRPYWNTPLGVVLVSYTNESSGIFDAEFNEQIRLLRSDWFENSADTKKQELLEMAKNGDARPSSSKTSLGSALVSYTNESSGIFDAEFNEQIRLLRSDWFENSADKNKEILLEMATNGDPRPSSKTSLGKALVKYTNESNTNRSFDAEFNEQIREANPDWFARSNALKVSLKRKTK